MLPKTSPNYLQYKIHKSWLLSWIHFIVIIRVITFECFKMQMVINLAASIAKQRKVNFYTCPRLTFLKKNATENAYKSISEPLDFKIFWGGMPPDAHSGSRLRHSKLASSCSEVWLRPCKFSCLESLREGKLNGNSFSKTAVNFNQNIFLKLSVVTVICHVT